MIILEIQIQDFATFAKLIYLALFIGFIAFYYSKCSIQQETGKMRIIQGLGGGIMGIIPPVDLKIYEDPNTHDLIEGFNLYNLSIFGYQMVSFFPTFKDYEYLAYKTMIVYGDIESTESRQVIYSQVIKDEYGKTKILNVIKIHEMINYIRPFLIIYIPLDDVEILLDDEAKNKGFEIVYAKCLVQVKIQITNFRKSINTCGGNFYDVLSMAIQAAVESRMHELTYTQFFKSKDEEGGNEAYLTNSVMTINEDRREYGGSDSYDSLHGFFVTDVTIAHRDFGSKSQPFVQAMQQTAAKQEQNKQKLAESATAKQMAKDRADAEAYHIKTVGGEENSVLKKRKPDPNAVQFAKGMKGLTGTLIIGEIPGSITPMFDVSKKSNPKPKTKKDMNNQEPKEEIGGNDE